MHRRAKRRPITLNGWLFLLSVTLLAGLVATISAFGITSRFELETRRIVERAIPAQDVAWVSLKLDGSLVRLQGDAPDETARFRVMEAVAEKINISRIDNQMTAPVADFGKPEVRLEIVQNDNLSSIVGMLPSQPSPVALYRALERVNPNVETLNLIEGVDVDPGPQWAGELAFLASVIEKIPNLKLSASPGNARVEAVVRDEIQAQTLRSELRLGAPSSMELDLAITAPRPLLVPFIFSLKKDEDGASLSHCSATDTSERQLIANSLPALKDVVMTKCALGLGAPSQSWGLLVSQLVKDTAELENYELTIRDNQVYLSYPDGVEKAKLDVVFSNIRAGLPPGFGFSPEAIIEVRTVEEISAEGEKTQLKMTRNKDGVRLEGLVGSDAVGKNLKSFAAAKFGSNAIDSSLNVVEGLPGEWEGNALLGLNALSMMDRGEIVLTQTHIAASGQATSKDDRAELLRLISQGKKNVEFAYKISTSDGSVLEPEAEEREALAEANQPAPITPLADDGNAGNSAEAPSGDQCLERFAEVLKSEPIRFEPGSSDITETSLTSVTRIAQILYECREFNFEIGGYTDNQGGKALNTELSQGRAKAVLDKINAQALEYGEITAKGYGPENPVASNETEEGREKNRRIELRLIGGDEN